MILRERKREGMNHELAASCTCPTSNLGMCPGQGSNPQLFSVPDNAATN